MTLELPAALPLPCPVVWSTRVSDRPFDSNEMWITSSTVITVSRTKGLICLDKWTGRLLWSVERTALDVSVLGDVLICSDYNLSTRRKTFTACSATNGEALWTRTHKHQVLDTTTMESSLLILSVAPDGSRQLERWDKATGETLPISRNVQLHSAFPTRIYWDGQELWTVGDACFRGNVSMLRCPDSFFFHTNGARVGVGSHGDGWLFQGSTTLLTLHGLQRTPVFGCGAVLVNDRDGVTLFDETTLERRWTVESLRGEEVSFPSFLGRAVGVLVDEMQWFDLTSGSPIAYELEISRTASTKDHTWWYQDGRVVLVENHVDADGQSTTIRKTPPIPRDPRLPERLDLPNDAWDSDFLLAVTQLDGNEIEALRDHVDAENLPWLVDAYWKLNTWSMRAAMLELLQDQDREMIRPIADDLLRGPEMADHQMMIAVAIVSGHTNDEVFNSDELYERCYREWCEATVR